MDNEISNLEDVQIAKNLLSNSENNIFASYYYDKSAETFDVLS